MFWFNAKENLENGKGNKVQKFFIYTVNLLTTNNSTVHNRILDTALQ